MNMFICQKSNSTLDQVNKNIPVTFCKSYSCNSYNKPIKTTPLLQRHTNEHPCTPSANTRHKL